MLSLIIGIILLIILVFGILKEPRNFINVILLVLSGSFLFIGLANLLSESEKMYIIPIILAFCLIPIGMLIISVFLIINGFIMIKKEGKSLKNLLSLFAGIGIIIGMCAGVFYIISYKLNTITYVILALIIIFATYFSSTFLGFFIYSILYSIIPKKLKCDYIIIHGCGLSKGEEVTPLLKNRIEKAIEIYERTKRTAVFIPSGGKGDDEKISEAEAIKRYLIKRGIPEEKIELEDKSTTTYENLELSKKMLDKKNKTYSCILVTNNYHVFRTSMYAKKLKMNAHAIGAKTALYYLPSAFIREYIALMMKLNWFSLLIFILWVLLTIISFS